ncbi:MAG: hypothetical protein ACOCP8_03850, partial [archaeon]
MKVYKISLVLIISSVLLITPMKISADDEINLITPQYTNNEWEEIDSLGEGEDGTITYTWEETKTESKNFVI